MLVDLPPGAREVLRPLFSGFRPLHGAWQAVLSTEYGGAVADDAQHPTAARLTLDFHFFAGDPTTPAARELVAGLARPAFLIAPLEWDGPFGATWGERVRSFERVVFGEPAHWDRTRLRSMASRVPAGFTTIRVDASNVARFRALADSLVYNFVTNEAFLRDGVGFGIEHEGRFVSGCSSFTLGGGKLEFEIQTDERYRRRGLAMAVAARMIEHCIDNGFEACWDAHNPPSAALARKLGFVDELAYTAYEVR